MRISIRGLVAALLGILLFSFGGIIWTNRSAANTEIIAGMETILSNVSASTTARSEDFLDDARASAEVVALAMTDNAFESTEALESYFGAFLTSDQNASGAFYGATNGEFIFVSRLDSDSEEGFLTKLINVEDGSRRVDLIYRDADFLVTNTDVDPEDEYDPRTRPWYQLATERSGTVLTDPYVFFTSQRPGITAAAPVYRADGSLSGVVGVDLELSDLSSFLSDLSLGPNGSAYIFNVRGEVIALEDLDRLKQPAGEGFRLTSVTELDSAVLEASFAASANLRTRPETFTVNNDGSTIHAFVAPIDGTDWILGVALDERDFFSNVRKEQQRSNLVAFALALIGIAVGWRLIQNVTGPLTELRNRALQIEAGRLIETEPSTAAIHELRTTSDAFDHMVKGLLKQRGGGEADPGPIDLLDRADGLGQQHGAEPAAGETGADQPDDHHVGDVS